MSHIPYFGEDEADTVVVKSNNKLTALLSALLLTINPASAQDVKKVTYQYEPEEIVVRALDLSEKTHKYGEIRVGLNNEVLIHVYDKKTDTWRYVNTKVTVTKSKD